MVEDTELLRRYVEHDSEEAFAEFIQRHAALFYFGAPRRTAGDSGIAAEVSPNVFITCDTAARKWALAYNVRIKRERWEPVRHFDLAEALPWR
jgi:hypothetical protein